MIILRSLVFCSIIGACFFSFMGCSSTSGTLRYNDKDQNGKLNSIAIDDSLLEFDEDFYEFQDPSDLPDDEAKIDLAEVLKNLDKKKDDSNNDALVSTKRDLMLMEIIRYLNTPYKYGGNSLDGIDCSAFTQSVYQSAWMLSINRSAREQYKQGIVIDDRSVLEFGDLVFFNTRKRVKPGHVGIYIGDNLFAHASTKLGVTISSLDHDYYNKRYMGARRIEEE